MNEANFRAATRIVTMRQQQRQQAQAPDGGGGSTDQQPQDAPSDISSAAAASPDRVAATSDALHALHLRDETLARRIAHLETIVADASLGVVRRTKAKVELALLQTSHEDAARQKQRKEIEAIQKIEGVKQTKRLVEQDISRNEDRMANEAAIRDHMADLHQQALERQREARLKAEEARIRSAEAEAFLKEAEREAEAAMAAAKKAMEKLHLAREMARKERRALEEARGVEESLLEEMERMKNKGDAGAEEKEGDAKTVEGEDAAATKQAEGADEMAGEESKQLDDELNAMKADLDDKEKALRQDAAKVAELTAQVAKLEVEVSDLTAANTRQRNKIASLEDHVAQSGEKQRYYQEQADKLSSTLKGVSKQRKELEEKLHQLKERASAEDVQVEHLRGEIQDLRSMKKDLELRLYVAEEQEKAKLQNLVEEIDRLIADKDRALRAVEEVQRSCEVAIAEREATMRDMAQDMELIHEELNRAHELLDEKEEKEEKEDEQTQIVMAASSSSSSSTPPSSVGAAPPPQNDQEDKKEESPKGVIDLTAEKEALLAAQLRISEQEIENMGQQLQHYHEAHREQRAELKKLTKQLKKSKGMQDAFAMQDREIERLNQSLAVEKEKLAKLRGDVKHWRESSTDLSKSLCVVQQQRNETQERMDEMQSKLSRRIFKLQQEVIDQKQLIRAEQSKVVGLKESSKIQDAIFTKKLVEAEQAVLWASMKEKEESEEEGERVQSIVEDDSYDDSMDEALEAKVDNSALEEILGRVLAERDRLVVENEQLLDASRHGSQLLDASRHGEQAITRSLTEPKRPSEHDDIFRARASFHDEKEAVVPKRISVHDETKPEPQQPKKKKKKTQVYQLTLKDGDSDLQYIGTAKGELQSQIHQHFAQVWEMVQRENFNGGEAKTAEDGDDDEDFVNSPFARHFARHCRNAKSAEEVAEWCHAHIKVGTQKIKHDEEEDDCFVARTVYQLSCKDPRCSKLHYIGSTHEELQQKVFKHANDIWGLVQKEYGEEGFCQDASDNKCSLGDFGNSASHFAKHCRNAKSMEEVGMWCKDNIKVEKWTMVCKTCLGTEVETPNVRNSSVVSFKSRVNPGRPRQ